MATNEKDLVTGEEIKTDETFSYDGYQIVRGEFFAHLNETTITFCDNKFGVNMACIKRMPEVEYIQVMMNQEQRRLVVRPCLEDEKESFVWCTLGERKKPKQITCRAYFAMVMRFTGWNPNDRHKLLGKIFRSGDETLFMFDLDSVQQFPRNMTDDGKIKTSRTPVFPAEWDKMFGPTVDEHRKQMEAKVFKGYTVFSVVDKEEAKQ